MDNDQPTATDPNEDRALRRILEGTVAQTGVHFFEALVQSLSNALGYRDAWITEFVDNKTIQTLAVWKDGELAPNFSYSLEGTPCESVVNDTNFVHHPDSVQEAYPQDVDLQVLGAISYLGVPLVDQNGHVLGHLAMLGYAPTPTEPIGLNVLKIFASRAEVELQQMHTRRRLLEEASQSSDFLESTLDAIFVVDEEMNVTDLNQSASQLLAFDAGEPTNLRERLSNSDLRKVAQLLSVAKAEQPYLLLPAGISISKGTTHHYLEGSVSKYNSNGESFYTFVVRDIEQRLLAQQRMEHLFYTQPSTDQVSQAQPAENPAAESLSQSILGQSQAMQDLLSDIVEVAQTNATVLICGETGTGKELVAKALHASSSRQTKPIIAINCAALPSELIESELFGHEKGAFTGASHSREGRFKLADSGTIFLDEIGDLPLSLQAKLLRVLQEGEFEPLGSSKTIKVDVRVIAATNCDLFQAVQDGNFREDLYYRLNVFPIDVPPLRERSHDIILLANAFLQEFAVQIGRPCAPLDEEMQARLLNYPWPGNVRELRNVMERAVICARQGVINLDRALPNANSEPENPDVEQILTIEALRDLERENIRQALRVCNGKVSGENGAAALLQMKPTTLSSRIQALEINTP